MTIEYLPGEAPMDGVDVNEQTADAMFDVYRKAKEANADAPTDGLLSENADLLAIVRRAFPKHILEGAQYSFSTARFSHYGAKALDLTFPSRTTDPRGPVEDAYRIRPSDGYDAGIESSGQSCTFETK